MKIAIYQVALGENTQSNLYSWCIDSVARYAVKIGADHIVQREPILKIAPDVANTNRSKESYEKHGGFLPIYEKENALDILKDYDFIAIIDADIFIREDAPSIFEGLDKDTCFAGVLESSLPSTPRYKNKIRSYSYSQYHQLHKSMGITFKDPTGYDFYNMGMMVLGKEILKHLKGMTAKEFLTQPLFKPFVDGIGSWKWSTDQTLLNFWVKYSRMKTENLHWKWNTLYTTVSKEDLDKSHFIHFFLKDHLPARGENIEQLEKEIKR
jgi:hypothetical protein